MLEVVASGEQGEDEPWLVWLSGWVLAWDSKGRWVESKCRAHALVAAHVPSRGHSIGNHTLMLLSLSPSFPLSKKINK